MTYLFGSNPLFTPSCFWQTRFCTTMTHPGLCSCSRTLFHSYTAAYYTPFLTQWDIKLVPESCLDLWSSLHFLKWHFIRCSRTSSVTWDDADRRHWCVCSFKENCFLFVGAPWSSPTAPDVKISYSFSVIFWRRLPVVIVFFNNFSDALKAKPIFQ